MKAAALLFAAMLCSAPAMAAPAGYFDLKPGVTLETGDTWNDGRSRYRLFGVQACLRGTSYTNNGGRRADCGEASMAMLAAFIKDTRPICAPIMRTGSLTYVMCYAYVGDQRADLGALLIGSGYAFAALNREGLPYHVTYAVSEQAARKKKAGLWQFKDVVHPSIFISRHAHELVKGASR